MLFFLVGQILIAKRGKIKRQETSQVKTDQHLTVIFDAK